MTTLLKFKQLATQCTRTPKSPSKKPSPRRRPTLGKLLSRSPSRGGGLRGTASAAAEEKNRGLLKDLLLLSPPPPPPDRERTVEIERERRPVAVARVGSGRRGKRSGAGSGGFRYRVVIRRAWRPVLVSIPE